MDKVGDNFIVPQINTRILERISKYLINKDHHIHFEFGVYLKYEKQKDLGNIQSTYHEIFYTIEYTLSQTKVLMVYQVSHQVFF